MTMATEFVGCTSEWGLTVYIPKTKAIVVNGSQLTSDVVLPRSALVEMVSEFRYLDGLVSGDGVPDQEISSRISKASRACGCLQGSIFHCRALAIAEKRLVYRSCVLSIVVYGLETWCVKQCHLRRLDVFRRSCVRCIFGVHRTTQWHARFSSAVLAQRASLPRDTSTLLPEYRLLWLGHVARMPPSRAPKPVLFGERINTRPRHGPRKRWKDTVAADTAILGVADWYSAVQERSEWYSAVQERSE